jgi:hypothetical protein
VVSASGKEALQQAISGFGRSRRLALGFTPSASEFASHGGVENCSTITIEPYLSSE